MRIVITDEMIITDILNDGFTMIKKKTLIPDLFFLRDKELQDTVIFVKNEKVKVSVEYVEQIQQDELALDKVTLFCVVNQLCPNGIYTKYYDLDKGKLHREFFYDGKGLITLPRLKEANPFEIGDFIKIEVEKVRK